MKRQFMAGGRQSTGKSFKSLLSTVRYRPGTLFTMALALVLGFTGNPAVQAQTINSTSNISIPLDNTLDSARSAGLASASVAVADDGSALFENPAGLGRLRTGELSLHHQIWLADTSQDTLLVALPLPGLGGMGIAAHYVDYGSFEGRDSTGTPMPSFSAQRIALDGGWGYQTTHELSLGLAIRVSQQSLAGNSYSFVTADGGLLFQPNKTLGLGVAFQGVGQSGGMGNLPLALNLGAAYRPVLSKDWGFLLAGQGTLENGGVNRLKAGTEAVYQGSYALRAGYQFDFADNQWEGLSGLTLGAGYQWKDLALDYAFLPMGDLGTSHRISLSYRFPSGTTAVSKGSGTAVLPTPAPSHVLQLGLPVAPVTGPAPVLPFGEETASSASHHPGEERDGLGGQIHLPADTLQQGKELEKQGRYVEAIHLYIQAVQENQKNLLAWWGLGNAYYRLGLKEYAGQCFEQVLRIKPDAMGLRDWLNKYKAASLTSTPGVSMTISTVSEISTGPSSASSEGDDLKVQFKVPADILKQAKELEKEGKYNEAISLYTQAIQGDQKNLLAWWGLGNIYYRLGKKDYAIQCFEEVLKIQPDSTRLKEWLDKYKGYFLKAGDRFKGSIKS